MVLLRSLFDRLNESLLLAAGADSKAQDNDHRTAQEIAEEIGQTQIAELPWYDCVAQNPDCQNMIYYGAKCGVTAWPPGKGPLGWIKALKEGMPSADPLLR